MRLAPLLLCFSLVIATQGYGQTSPQPDPRVIRLRLAISPNFEKLPNWKEDLKIFMGYAGTVLLQGAAIDLRYDLDKDIIKWNPTVTEAQLAEGNKHQLTFDLEKSIPTKGYDLVLGIHPHPENTEARGKSLLLGQFPWVRPMLMSSDAYPEMAKQKAQLGDPEKMMRFEDAAHDQLLWQNAFMIVHEILNAFGAVHVKRETSFMNQRSLEPGSKFIAAFFGENRVDFGSPPTKQILAVTRTMDFSTGCKRLSDEALKNYLEVIKINADELDPPDATKHAQPVTALYRHYAQQHVQAEQFPEATVCLEKLVIVQQYEPNAIDEKLLDDVKKKFIGILDATAPTEKSQRQKLEGCIARISALIEKLK